MTKSLQQLISNASIPGISIAFCRQDEIQSAAAGITDSSAPRAVNTSTLFQAASLSKPVSAAIVLNLVNEGLWDLDKPLAEIADYAPPIIKNHRYYKKLTTRMVLGQCSGLPNWLMANDDKGFISEPGTSFNYSGIAFEFLKDVIEQNTHKKWEVLAQAFFQKVGMNNSTFKQLHVGHLKGRIVARGHTGDGLPDPVEAPLDSPEIPAASLFTTASDYIIFLRYCFSNPFLSSTLFAENTSLSNVGSKIQWGLGMGILDHNGKKIAFHWGNNPTSHAFTAIDLSNGDCVACFANSANGPNVFKPFTESIVGDMSPVFDWLSKYAGFNAAAKPKSQTSEKDYDIFKQPRYFMTSTTEEKTLEAQQNITQKNANKANISTPKLSVGPNECPGCRHTKIACKCPGGGKNESEKNKDNDDALGKTQDQTNSQVKPQLTPFKLILTPNNNKVSKEHLENSEFYEIQEGKTPQDVLAFFHAHLNRLAATQNKTSTDLAKEGFSGKIEGNVVVLTFPNAQEREKFRQAAVSPNVGLIKPALLNPNNSNSIGQQMLARMTNPQNRKTQE